jgi:hypothetical protein
VATLKHRPAESRHLTAETQSASTSTSTSLPTPSPEPPKHGNTPAPTPAAAAAASTTLPCSVLADTSGDVDSQQDLEEGEIEDGEIAEEETDRSAMDDELPVQQPVEAQQPQLGPYSDGSLSPVSSKREILFTRTPPTTAAVVSPRFGYGGVSAKPEANAVHDGSGDNNAFEQRIVSVLKLQKNTTMHISALGGQMGPPPGAWKLRAFLLQRPHTFKLVGDQVRLVSLVISIVDAATPARVVAEQRIVSLRGVDVPTQVAAAFEQRIVALLKQNETMTTRELGSQTGKPPGSLRLTAFLLERPHTFKLLDDQVSLVTTSSLGASNPAATDHALTSTLIPSFTHTALLPSAAEDERLALRLAAFELRIVSLLETNNGKTTTRLLGRQIGKPPGPLNLKAFLLERPHSFTVTDSEGGELEVSLAASTPGGPLELRLAAFEQRIVSLLETNNGKMTTGLLGRQTGKPPGSLNLKAFLLERPHTFTVAVSDSEIEVSLAAASTPAGVAATEFEQRIVSLLKQRKMTTWELGSQIGKPPGSLKLKAFLLERPHTFIVRSVDENDHLRNEVSLVMSSSSSPATRKRLASRSMSVEDEPPTARVRMSASAERESAAAVAERTVTMETEPETGSPRTRKGRRGKGGRGGKLRYADVSESASERGGGGGGSAERMVAMETETDTVPRQQEPIQAALSPTEAQRKQLARFCKPLLRAITADSTMLQCTQAAYVAVVAAVAAAVRSTCVRTDALCCASEVTEAGGVRLCVEVRLNATAQLRVVGSLLILTGSVGHATGAGIGRSGGATLPAGECELYSAPTPLTPHPLSAHSPHHITVHVTRRCSWCWRCTRRTAGRPLWRCTHSCRLASA